MFLFFPSCGKKEQQLASAVKESDSLPDMRTIGVTTLISDSGMIRYKIITAEWLIYSHRNPPFWAFEKGIYLEKFDNLDATFLKNYIVEATDERIFAIAELLRRNVTIDEIYQLTKIDKYFLYRIRSIIELENQLKKKLSS